VGWLEKILTFFSVLRKRKNRGKPLFLSFKKEKDGQNRKKIADCFRNTPCLLIVTI
jgi:hypothetical protein